MKIIFSHYGVLDGGDANGFTRSFMLASGIAEQGNTVYFLTTQKKGFKFPFEIEMRDGVIIYAFPEILGNKFRKGGLSPLSTILKIFFVLFLKADVVHSDTGHRPNSGWPCIMHRLIYKSKYFSEWWEHFGRGGIFDDMPSWYQGTLGLYDIIFETRNRLKADGCLPISHQLKKRALELGINERKIVVLNGGCDVKRIPFVENNQVYRKEFQIPLDAVLVGIIGLNTEEIENHINIFRAIKVLNKNGYNFKILATGKLSHGDLKQYNFQDILHFFDWLSYNDFCRLISCADLFALVQKDNTRNNSRFPNKLGDYLAASRPILTNGIGEVKHYIDAYPHAFIVAKNSLTDIEKQLIRLNSIVKQKKIDYGYIRNIAHQNSWNKRAKKLSMFYSDICNNT